MVFIYIQGLKKRAPNIFILCEKRGKLHRKWRKRYHLWVGITCLEVQLVSNHQTFLFHRELVGVAVAILIDSSKGGGH